MPHRYVESTPDQKKRFRAEVHFFTAHQRAKFFEEAVATYYRADNASESDSGVDYERDQDEDDIDA